MVQSNKNISVIMSPMAPHLTLSPEWGEGIWNGDIFVFLMVPPPAGEW